jgi:hypothetical protein
MQSRDSAAIGAGKKTSKKVKLTVKVGSSGAALVADSATELVSSLSTFWSSAFTPLTRKAALAAAAATLNFILGNRVLSQAAQ